MCPIFRWKRKRQERYVKQEAQLKELFWEMKQRMDSGDTGDTSVLCRPREWSALFFVLFTWCMKTLHAVLSDVLICLPLIIPQLFVCISS